jgi:hypothetical protein
VFREHYALVRSERAAAAVVYPPYTLSPRVRAGLSAVIALVIHLYEESPGVKRVVVDAEGVVRERRSSLYRLIDVRIRSVGGSFRRPISSRVV